MSHEKVKAITLKDNKVFLTSADSSIRPLYFHRWECEPLSKIFAEQGREAVLAVLGKDIWNGELHLYRGNKLCDLFLDALYVIPSNLHFSNYDGKTAGEFLARMVMKLERDSRADLDLDVQEMLSKRNDRDYILEAARSTGWNYLNYACEELQQDRDLNFQVLDAVHGRSWMEYPVRFSADREFALKALQYNGCYFRSLAPSLCEDKDIIRLAFKEDGRTYHEHLPDLLPDSILDDKEFMKELIEICPSLHLNRTPHLLMDKELALTFARFGKFLPYNVDIIPKEFLACDQFKSVLLDRFGDGEKYAKLREKYVALGLEPPVVRRPSLVDQIHKAEAQKGSDTDSIGKGKDNMRGNEHLW